MIHHWNISSASVSLARHLNETPLETSCLETADEEFLEIFLSNSWQLCSISSHFIIWLILFYVSNIREVFQNIGFALQIKL